MDLDAQQVAVLVAFCEEMLALDRCLATLAVTNRDDTKVASAEALDAVGAWLDDYGHAPVAVRRAMLAQANLTAYVFHSMFDLAEARGAQWEPGDRDAVWASLMTADAGRVEEQHREALDHAPPRTD